MTDDMSSLTASEQVLAVPSEHETADERREAVRLAQEQMREERARAEAEIDDESPAPFQFHCVVVQDEADYFTACGVAGAVEGNEWFEAPRTEDVPLAGDDADDADARARAPAAPIDETDCELVVPVTFVDGFEFGDNMLVPRTGVTEESKARTAEKPRRAQRRARIEFAERTSPHPRPASCGYDQARCISEGCFGARWRRIGEFIVLSERRDGSLRLVIGPYWHYALVHTVPAILLPAGLVAGFILPRMHWAVAAAYAALVAWTLGWLALTSTSDPGIAVRVPQQPPDRKQWIYSDQTASWRHVDTKYAIECGALVEGFDHVCPWTGTAIGRQNMPYYWRFVLSAASLLVVTLGLVIAFVVIEKPFH